MNPYCDYKCTIWRRIHFDSKDLEKVKNLIDSKIDVNDIFYDGDEEIAIISEDIFETEEFMPIEENDMQSTIELYDKYGNFIKDNTIKDE